MKVSIKAMRVHRNFSITEAAEGLRVAPSTLRNWESGRTSPDARQLQDLLNLYECDYCDIILPS